MTRRQFIAKVAGAIAVAKVSAWPVLRETICAQVETWNRKHARQKPITLAEMEEMHRKLWRDTVRYWDQVGTTTLSLDVIDTTAKRGYGK